MRHLALSLALILSTLGLSATPAAQVHELPNVPLVSSGWQEKFWTHPDGTKFHYLEWGTGTPVILIHGSGGTALNWMMNGLGRASPKRTACSRSTCAATGRRWGPTANDSAGHRTWTSTCSRSWMR